QRMDVAGRPKLAAMAGNAMLTMESSDTTNTPPAAIQGVTGRILLLSWACGSRRCRGKRHAMDIKTGASAEVTITVTADRTADAMGNRGVKVLATPFLVGLLENACHAVLGPYLPVGAGTVGAMVEMRHLAATPVGMNVRAKATLLETDGRRYLFAVEAWDDKDKIAEGRHERVLVADIMGWLERAMNKAGS